MPYLDPGNIGDGIQITRRSLKWNAEIPGTCLPLAGSWSQENQADSHNARQMLHHRLPNRSTGARSFLSTQAGCNSGKIVPSDSPCQAKTAPRLPFQGGTVAQAAELACVFPNAYHVTCHGD